MEILGYTATDFKNVILGEAVSKQVLTVETTITKIGLANLAIFF